MAEQISLLKAALEYMDTTNALTNIQRTAEFYRETQDKTFLFKIFINPVDVLQRNTALGNLLLNHPNGAVKIFQEIVFETLKNKDILPQCTSQNQVVVTFDLQSLPELPGYRLNSSSDLTKFANKRKFLRYQGIITGRSTVHKYTKSARFFCPESACSGSEGNKYIRIHIPGAREAQTIRGDFTCSYCGSCLEEDLSCRLLADRLIVEAVDTSSFTHQDFGKKRIQAITLYVRDEYVNIEIGQEIDVIGVPVFDFYQNKLALEINNILNYNCKSKDCTVIPTSILKLHDDRKKSPWSFTLSLAYAFAGDITAAGTFIHLKLGLLLSLVGDATKESVGLDLLAVGSDTLLLDSLLSYGAELTDRSIVHSNNHHLTSALTKDRHGSGIPFIEGGSILLSGNGVCVLSNLGHIKKTTKYELLHVLESNTVFIDVKDKNNKQSAAQLFLPRRCVVWGSCEPSHGRKTTEHNSDELIGTVDQEHVTQDLADAFGQVYFCEVKPNTYADYLLLNHELMQAMSYNADPLISKSELKEYIMYVRQKSIKFTEEAEQLIRRYYVASRRVRTSGLHSISLPVTAIKVITSLAGAHAKLSLRDEVCEFDATIAILLYEENITFRSGYSFLNVQPLVHLPDNNIQQHLGPQLDKDMLQFHQLLKHFLATHASEVDRFTEE